MSHVKLGVMRRGSCVLVMALATGCSTIPRQPPGAPPTPETITREDPGGDAHDPHLAALLRLVNEPWGYRQDKQDALRIPMPDFANWRRVKFFGVPAFAAFRYGDSHHAVLGVWVRPVEAADDGNLAACLDRFENWGEAMARTFRVKTTQPVTTEARWSRGELVIRSLDARIDTLLSRKSYAAAYAAYRMWPGTCTVIGVAIASRDVEDEAKKARDRYVQEGFARILRDAKQLPEL